jgi:hypothetical protein
MDDTAKVLAALVLMGGLAICQVVTVTPGSYGGAVNTWGGADSFLGSGSAHFAMFSEALPQTVEACLSSQGCAACEA